MIRNIALICICFFSLSAKAQANKQPVLRGTWITNVASDAMLSPENVQKAVINCKKNGLTDIFVVVWNGGITTYPSEVLHNYIGIKQSPIYNNFDPLKAFVTEGHKAGLRVHAWFEFGASYAYKDSVANGWLAKYPSWAGRNNKNELLKKNGFFWWNAMHPDVQTFLEKLMLEVVSNYDVDGVQADIYSMAKGMGNGFPIGGILIAPHIAPKYGMLGTTFGGNHLACAAALAVVDVMEQENLLANAASHGTYLMEALSKIPQLQNVRGRGLMIGFDVPDSIKDLKKVLLQEYKVFTGEAKPNVIRLLPSLAISRAEIDIFLERLQKAIQSLL
jgi:hypothetical protein